MDMKDARELFSAKLIMLINDVDFEYGMDNECDVFVRESMSVYRGRVMTWLNILYNDNISNKKILIGILRILARLDFKTAYPICFGIVRKAAYCNDTEIVESAVRALESWGTAECLKLLENINVQEPWLQEYINEVIVDLEKRNRIEIAFIPITLETSDGIKTIGDEELIEEGDLDAKNKIREGNMWLIGNFK